MSIIGIDLGSKRIGIAVSDSGIMATPHSVMRNEGDIIDIDLEERSLNVRMTDAEIQARLDVLPPFKSKIQSKWLRRYAHFVTSAEKSGWLSA